MAPTCHGAAATSGCVGCNGKGRGEVARKCRSHRRWRNGREQMPEGKLLLCERSVIVCWQMELENFGAWQGWMKSGQGKRQEEG